MFKALTDRITEPTPKSVRLVESFSIVSLRNTGSNNMVAFLTVKEDMLLNVYLWGNAVTRCLNGD